MQILNPSQIKSPKFVGVIEEEIKAEDWLMGAMGKAPINPSMDWVDYVTEYELQRNNLFDEYACVTHSVWNMAQALINFKFKIKIDKSKRYTAVISGTQPRRGNSMQAPYESVRKNGGVDETEWPTMTPQMTEIEFYKAIPNWLKLKENFLKEYQFNHEWLPSGTGVPTPEQVMTALTISPVGVCINGNYEFDANGNLCNDGQISHAICIVKADVENKRWLAVDSENPNGLLPIKWNYKFRYCKIGYVEKKNSTPLDKPFIQFGKGIYQLAKEGKYKGQYVGWNNGDAFKAIVGNYNSVPLFKVNELPSNMSDVLVDILKNPQIDTGAQFDLTEWLQNLFK